MEKDLSLIEISAEDDSLLCNSQHISNDAAAVSTSNSTAAYFACSPLLQIPRSNGSLLRRPPPPLPPKIESREGGRNERGCGPSASSGTDSVDNLNKENVSVSKHEMQKLVSLEPQQMKRKKKGGGFNLRKSLAWDRAFFTEEGVLDPLELSILSGNFGKSSGGGGGETLTAITEGRESLVGGSESPGQALEENLFKEVPASCSLNESSKITGIVAASPKPGSSVTNKVGPTSAAKRKVLSAHDVNSSASKRSGCPRPIPSPSSSTLKRPSQVNTTKGVSKDSKVSKRLVPRLDHPATAGTSRSSINLASNLKRNQIAQPGNSQKSSRIKSSSRNTTTARNETKSGPVGKSIKKPTVQQARRNLVSSKPEIQPATNAQRSQVTKANNGSVAVPYVTLSAAAHLPNAQDGSTSETAVCHSQATMHNPQPQTTKPSGLRMPSPSMGFFGQSKPSFSNSLLQKSNQPCNLPKSNISKLGALKSIHQRPPKPPAETPAQPSAVSSVSSAVKAASLEKIKFNLEFNIMPKVEMQVPNNSKSFDTLYSQQQSHNILDDIDHQLIDCGEQCMTRMISQKDDMSFQNTNNKLLTESVPCIQLRKGVDGEGVTDVFQKSRDLNGAESGYPHLMSDNSLAMDVEDLSGINNSTVSQHVEDLQYHLSPQRHRGSSEFQFMDANNDNEQAELMKPDTSDVDPVSGAESHRLSMNNGTWFDGSKSSKELEKSRNANAADTSFKDTNWVASKSDTPSGLPRCEDVEPRNDSGNLVDNLSDGLQTCLKEGSLPLMLGTSAVSTPHTTIIDDLSEKSSEQAVLPVSSLETEQDSKLNNESHHNDSFLEEKNVSKEFQHKNIIQTGETVAPRRIDSCRGELESSSISYSIPPIKQDCGFDVAGNVELLNIQNTSVASVGNETVVENIRNDKDCGDFYGNEANKAQVPSPFITVKQPGNDACCNKRGTSVSHMECYSNQHTVERFVESPKLLNSCSCIAEQENQSQEIHSDLMSVESRSFKDSLKFKSGNDVSASGIGGSGSESPHDLCRYGITEQPYEHAGPETKMEDSHGRLLEGTLSVDCSQSIITTLVANENCLIVFDKSNEQHEEHPELQSPDIPVEQDPLENHGFHSDVNLLFSSVELQERNGLRDLFAVPLEECESKSSDVCVQENHDKENIGVDLDKKREQSSVNNPTSGSVEAVLPGENIQCQNDGNYKDKYRLPYQDSSSEFGSSLKKSADQIPFAARTCDSKPFLLNVSLESLLKTAETSSSSILHNIEVSLSERSKDSLEDDEINLLQESNCLHGEMQPELDALPSTGNEDARFSGKRSVNGKQDALVVKPPPDAVPFSDEWLAAFEAAGEGILSKKGGAVQNSPPEKPLPDPSPWSPVKRKNNQGIGPYDCTKYTNANIPPFSSS